MAPQQNQKALWAMILGIGAIAGAIIFFCFYIVGLLCGIPAIVLGMLAKKEIDGSHGAQTGRGMATAGLVTGIIGVVLNLALLAFFIALIATEGFGDPNW